MRDDPRRLHLTSWREVRDHVGDTHRWPRYHQLLDDFGIDTEVADRGRQATPRFVYAEHPGNWAYPADLVRIRLASALAERFDTDADILQFDNDVFRKNGIKRFFSKWCLHRRLPWVSLVRAKDTRSHQAWHRRVYGSVQLQGRSRQSLMDKWAMAVELMGCVARGEHPLALLNAPCPPGAREVIGGPWSRREAQRLADSMAECQLHTAQEPLRVGLAILQQGEPTWSALWQHINSVLLGQPVGRVDPIFESFLLSIRDPEKMAHRLAALEDNCSPHVTVAGLVEDGEFRRVVYERRRGCFLALRSTGDPEGRPISWDAVRHHARHGLGGTPGATVEYLMMAASGFFVVCDPYDGQTPFERRVALLHQESIDRRFPWVSIRHHFQQGHSGSYLDCYHAALDQFALQRIDREFFSDG